MLVRRLVVAAVLGAMSFPLTATAAQPDARSAPEAREMDLDRDELSTDLLEPPLYFGCGLPHHGTTLIQPRTDFIAELVKSVDDL